MLKTLSARVKIFSLACAITLAACLSGSLKPARADIAVQNGQKIAFMGDSITANGWGHSTGYVNLVVSALKTNGVTVTPIPAGVSGETSKNMLARLDRDVLGKKPDWMTLSCGVNDVWHGANGGVPLDQYKTNITSIVDQAKAAGIKVVILTSTPIGEDLTAANTVKLADYNAFLKDLATKENCPLADLNAGMQEGLKAKTLPGNYLTADGVHMNPRGDQIMASGILKALGMSDDQIAKAREVWLDIPGGWPITVTVPATIHQYEALVKQAQSQKTTPEAILAKAAAEQLNPAK